MSYKPSGQKNYVKDFGNEMDFSLSVESLQAGNAPSFCC